MPILSQFYTKRPLRMCNFLFQHGFDPPPPLNVRQITILVLLNIPYSNVTSTTTNKNNAGWRNTRTLRCPSWGEASLCRLRSLIAFGNNRVFRKIEKLERPHYYIREQSSELRYKQIGLSPNNCHFNFSLTQSCWS